MPRSKLVLLQDKVILITGASRGIGQATALLAAKYRTKIVVNYYQERHQAEAVADQIDNLGSQAIVVHGDVSRENQMEVVIGHTIGQFGWLDILINNAGIFSNQPFLQDNLTNLNRMIDINLKGTVNSNYTAARVMKTQKEGGVIVNIASGAGKTAYPGMAVYSATKFAVLGFTQAVAQELISDNIRVYAVCPGLTATDMTGHQGMAPTKVARRILQVAVESAGLKPGEDSEIYS